MAGLAANGARTSNHPARTERSLARSNAVRLTVPTGKALATYRLRLVGVGAVVGRSPVHPPGRIAGDSK